MRDDSRTHFLVLASRLSFESLVGVVPDSMRQRFQFQKPTHEVRIQALLPKCRILITKNYRKESCNRWVFEARRRGIPTLLLVDGPLEWSNLGPDRNRSRLFEPISHDAVACLGPVQEKWILSRNANREIVAMQYANHRIRTLSPESRRPQPEFDFLLTTAKTPYFNEREKINLAGMLENCAAALAREQYKILVRLFDDDLRTLVRQKIPNATFVEKGSFTESAGRTRCVIGTPSSVILEAMLLQKPTAQLAFRDGPLFYQSGWLLGGASDWPSSFASMISCDPERMKFQEQTLRENLSSEDFFSHCEAIATGQLLIEPRPFDAPDRAIEKTLSSRAVARERTGRWLSPVIRSISSRWR